MANQTINYGTTVTLGVGTTPNSLASGSAGQTDALDNSGLKAVDYEFELACNGSGAGNTGAVNVWAAGSVDGGTTYADGASGTNGSFTAANRKNARWVGSITLASTAAQRGILQQTLLQAMGGWAIPEKTAFIYTNDSGAALASSGFSLKARPITYDIT